MIRRQTARQHLVSQLQPANQGFFQWKYQKPHLEILGSLIFCVGLTLTKPASAATNVSAAELSLSNTDRKENVGVTSTSKEADTIQTRPKVLPPVTIETSAKEWSQPISRDDTGIREHSKAALNSIISDQLSTHWCMSEELRPPDGTQSDHCSLVTVDTGTRGFSDMKNSSGNMSNLWASPPSPNSLSKSPSLSFAHKAPEHAQSQAASGEKMGEGENSLTPGVSLIDSNLSPVSINPSPGETCMSTSQEKSLDCGMGVPLVGENSVRPELEPSSEFPVTSSCSNTQQQTLPSELKPPCSPRVRVPNLVADVENATPPTPQHQPRENRLESEPPASDEDPELGKLRLRELAAPPPPSKPSKPAVYLLGGAGYFRSNNIFSGVDPIDDGLFRAGVTLLATPSVGPNTSLFASVGGNIYRYSDLSEYNYDELNFSAGIRQQIGSRTYGELGWTNRQLFSQDSGDRFLQDHSVSLELGRRDFLSKKLTLDSFYQLRVSFANPSDRSQVTNSVGASLGYSPIPPLEVALDYQFAFADFTQQERQDQYHQLIASLNYTLSPNSRFYLYGGQSFGNSTDPFTDFDGLVFGAGVSLNLTLF